MKFSWQKLGNIFKPEDFKQHSWMSSYAQGPCSLVRDEDVRFFFSTRPRSDSSGAYVSYTAYIDVCRDEPTKIVRRASRPVMPLGGRGCFDEFGIYPFSVIRDNGLLRGYYGGWTRPVSVPFDVAIGQAISLDEGETFERVGSGPVLAKNFDEPFILSGPKIRKFGDQYYLFYIAGQEWFHSGKNLEPIYRIRMATSFDGVNWTRQHRNLITTKLGEIEAQASPDVFYLEGRFHMVFCFRSAFDYRGGDGSYRIGYAYSDDLTDWIRNDDAIGLTTSAGQWDSEMLSYPHFFTVDDRSYLAYMGNNFGRDGFGLAQLVGLE